MIFPSYDHHFTETTLARAEGYCNSDDIIIIDNKDGIINAMVQGSHNYSVKILWDDNDYIQLSCDCPYDHDGNCKHLAAVILYLEQGRGKVSKERSGKTTMRKAAKSLEEYLAKATKAQVIAAIQNVIRYNPDTRSMIEYYFEVQSEDNIMDFEKRINKYIKSNSDRNGYIHWHRYGEILSHFNTELKVLSESGKYVQLIELCLALIHKFNDILMYNDDSNGVLSSVLSDAHLYLTQMVEENLLSTPQKNKLIDSLFGLLNVEGIDAFDSEYEIWKLLGISINTVEQYERFVDVTNHKIDKSEDGWSKNYLKVNALILRIDMLKNLGLIDDFHHLINDNIELNKVREIKLSMLLEQNKIYESEKLINDGIEIYNKNNHSGDAARWKEHLLELKIKHGSKEEILTQSLEVLYNNRFSLERVSFVKSKMNSTQWEEEKKNILQKFTDPRHHASIYEMDGHSAELMNLVELEYTNDFYFLDEYFNALISKYPERVIALYRKIIYNFADRNVSRKYYKVIARYLNKLAKLSTLEQASMIAKDLVSIYPSRRAMKEELLSFL